MLIFLRYAQYLALIARHATSFASIHSSQFFLPWHRWFQMEMENLLQNVNCEVTIPWWDTSKNAGHDIEKDITTKLSRLSLGQFPVGCQRGLDRHLWFMCDRRGLCQSWVARQCPRLPLTLIVGHVAVINPTGQRTCTVSAKLRRLY